MLTGTGLDAVRYPGRVGTDPAYLRLVTLESPDLLNEGIMDSVTRNAMFQGTYSRIMCTNTRMFFRAIQPILTMEMHTVEPKSGTSGVTLSERLARIGSFRDLMDYAPRMYVSSNAIANVDGSVRSKLLEQAFLYHMKTAIEDRLYGEVKQVTSSRLQKILANELKAVSLLLEANAVETGIGADEIFTSGLAKRRDTSAALKYLACFGLSSELWPGFGDEFEELTTLHYMRRMQVEGYTTRRHVLKYAWPPSDVKNGRLNAKLAEQAQDEFLGLNFAEITDKVCVVFSQGTPTAQGADILALVRNGDVAFLDAIQCKHRESIDAKQVFGWWDSLGISTDVDSRKVAKTDNAEYSWKGLQGFRRLLSKRLGIPVSFGKRIMAVSTKTPPRAKFPVPPGKNNYVWFREMLEPTISAVAFDQDLCGPNSIT